MSKKRYWILLVLLGVLVTLRWCYRGGGSQAPVTVDMPTVDEPADTVAATLRGGGGLDVAEVDCSKAGRTVKRDYDGYTAYYSPEWNVPRCTVYELTRGKTRGKASREGILFRDDTAVPGSAWSSDYKDSGYTRGHMTPAGDMKWSARALEQTFFTTNICPQLAEMNENAWGDLEKKVREWARRDEALVVITGPVVDRRPKTIGRKHRVAVPRQFFKVVVAHRARPMRAIAFLYDHRDGDRASISSHAVSIDSIEALTGLDLLCRLPRSTQDTLERSSNADRWLW